MGSCYPQTLNIFYFGVNVVVASSYCTRIAGVINRSNFAGVIIDNYIIDNSILIMFLILEINTSLVKGDCQYSSTQLKRAQEFQKECVKIFSNSWK